MENALVRAFELRYCSPRRKGLWSIQNWPNREYFGAAGSPHVGFGLKNTSFPKRPSGGSGFAVMSFCLIALSFFKASQKFSESLIFG
ncbi:hypothetical protein C7476_11135 [Phyllobacterium bourgognense]|uniref:Uncharacterized protein n=1 Tax=Phyllobacterium bourgognense TaxID=314236 RepID=A0A368YLQ7_9HYPH|nr:hypothetical protein C7476_11135 [Phyllobacterium bourgognense]